MDFEAAKGWVQGRHPFWDLSAKEAKAMLDEAFEASFRSENKTINPDP